MYRFRAQPHSLKSEYFKQLNVRLFASVVQILRFSQPSPSAHRTPAALRPPRPAPHTHRRLGYAQILRLSRRYAQNLRLFRRYAQILRLYYRYAQIFRLSRRYAQVLRLSRRMLIFRSFPDAMLDFCSFTADGMLKLSAFPAAISRNWASTGEAQNSSMSARQDAALGPFMISREIFR